MMLQVAGSSPALARGILGEDRGIGHLEEQPLQPLDSFSDRAGFRPAFAV